MTILASNIINRVRTQLIDPAGSSARWTDAELLQWLSDGCRSVVALAPGATSQTSTLAMVAGSRQFIPTDGHMLLGVTRNTDVTGNTGGRAVRIVSREVLDTQNPLWHSDTASAIVVNYVFDPQEPKKFYVYPPNTGAGYIEVVYSQLTPEITTTATTFQMQEVYQTALFDYVMFRAHQKDGAYSDGMELANSYFNAFYQFVSKGEDGQTGVNPNVLLSPDNAVARGKKQ